MNRSEIAARVIEHIEDKLGFPKGDVKEESNLVDDLGCDSLDLIEMVMDYEKDFTVAISDHESEKIKTVKDVIDLIVEKTK